MLHLGDNMSDSREILVSDKPDDDVVTSSTPDMTSQPAVSRDEAEVRLDVRGLSSTGNNDAVTNSVRDETADVDGTRGDNTVSSVSNGCLSLIAAKSSETLT